MVLNLLKTTVKGNMIHFVFQGVHKDKNKLSLWLPEREREREKKLCSVTKTSFIISIELT